MVVKTEIYFATRKTANAHVYINKAEKGREGSVRVNNVPIDMVEPEMAREVILVPLEIGISEDSRNKIEISVRVSGGGFMGQSYAAATAITRALIGWTKNKGILKIIRLQNLKEVTLERRLMNLINILLVVTQDERSLRNLVDQALEEENKSHIAKI